MLEWTHHYLNELKRIINTPNYVTNYFKTKDGMNFSKVKIIHYTYYL